MDTQQERLSHLDHALSNGENICSSEGMLCSFPTSLKKPFMINGAGLIVCRQGNFTFSLNMKVFSAQAGETVFIPEDSLFQVLSESEDLQLFTTLVIRFQHIQESPHVKILLTGSLLFQDILILVTDKLIEGIEGGFYAAVPADFLQKKIDRIR